MLHLGIDLGEKRTGLALGSDETGIITPLQVLDVPWGPRLVEALCAAVKAHGPDGLVVGLPLNMDGTEGPAAQRIRALGAQLGHAAGVPVHFQDERLTSHAAEEHLKQSGKTRGEKKGLRDALAAMEILKEFLDVRRE